MAETQSITIHQSLPTLYSPSCYNRVHDLVHNSAQRNSSPSDFGHYDEEGEDDFVLCVPGSRLIRPGPTYICSAEDFLKFVNAGGNAILGEGDTIIASDTAFIGGEAFRTDEEIINSDKLAPLYQSARVGNCCYQFENLSTGDYLVDLHFAEIINTNGPKGIRVFDVSMQNEKVIMELDIYSIIGSNKPLQLVDVRVSVAVSGVLQIKFEGIHGSPIICGICIRKASQVSQVKEGDVICHNCATEIEVKSSQNKLKAIAKYEKKIKELSTQCQLKTEECHQAWMSLTALNQQFEKVRMELDNQSFQNHCLDDAMVQQKAKLRDASSKHQCDKKSWVAAISELERKIGIMKKEHSQLSYKAHECVDSIPNLSKMVSAVQGLVAQCDYLKLQYSEELITRKKLYNQIQEAKGNIRVFCRCRPLNTEEVSAGCATIVDFDGDKEGHLGIFTGGSAKKTYKFDRFYSPKDNQVDVFDDALPLVISVLDGYNVCIFAYGQTGTGKTFTMEGTEQNRGVNYRTLELLFKLVEERSETFTYNISVNMLEVYNEQIRDLLATTPASKKLEVKQASKRFHHVPGLEEPKVENIEEAWNVLQAGSNARAVGSNNVNEHSSRSHCMFCIIIKAQNLMNGECTKSKLWLVDLAGSERLAKTDVQGDRLKEAQNINRSLSALGDVISALAVKSSHIPYRSFFNYHRGLHFSPESLVHTDEVCGFMQELKAHTFASRFSRR